MHAASKHVDLGGARLGGDERQDELRGRLRPRSGMSGQPQLGAPVERSGHLDAYFRAAAVDLADRALELQRLGGRIAFFVHGDRSRCDFPLARDDAHRSSILWQCHRRDLRLTQSLVPGFALLSFARRFTQS